MLKSFTYYDICIKYNHDKQTSMIFINQNVFFLKIIRYPTFWILFFVSGNLKLVTQRGDDIPFSSFGC